FSARTIPDFASRRLARTSCVLLPMGETIPIPVTTTRLMLASCAIACPVSTPRRPSVRSRSARLHHGILPEQPDLQILGAVDHLAVGGEPAVGNTEHEF